MQLRLPFSVQAREAPPGKCVHKDFEGSHFVHKVNCDIFGIGKT